MFQKQNKKLHKTNNNKTPKRQKGRMLWNNPAHCEYYMFLSLVNKEADWLIAKQDTVTQDNQTEDTGMKSGGVRELLADAERAKWACRTEKRHQGVAKHR